VEADRDRLAWIQVDRGRTAGPTAGVAAVAGHKLDIAQRPARRHKFTDRVAARRQEATVVRLAVAQAEAAAVAGCESEHLGAPVRQRLFLDDDLAQLRVAKVHVVHDHAGRDVDAVRIARRRAGICLRPTGRQDFADDVRSRRQRQAVRTVAGRRDARLVGIQDAVVVRVDVNGPAGQSRLAPVLEPVTVDIQELEACHRRRGLRDLQIVLVDLAHAATVHLDVVGPAGSCLERRQIHIGRRTVAGGQDDTAGVPHPDAEIRRTIRPRGRAGARRHDRADLDGTRDVGHKLIIVPIGPDDGVIRRSDRRAVECSQIRGRRLGIVAAA